MEKKSDKLKGSTQRLKEKARERVTQREVFHFRLEPENIEALYEFAKAENLPVGTMVRKWVVERINAERAGSASSSELLFVSEPQSSYIAQAGRAKQSSKQTETIQDLKTQLTELERRVQILEKKD
jgi:bacterioferritin (cytochrome b1)